MAHSKKNTDAYFQRLNSCISIPQDEILVALREDNLRLFSDLINEDDLDLNYEYKEENHSTLLHLCLTSENVKYRQLEYVEVLLSRGANMNLPHRILSKYPLHIAAENGLWKIVRILLDAGADVNVKMENGSTPLHLAAVRSACKWSNDENLTQLKKSFVIIVQFLLNTVGINIDSRNNIGITPLYFAIDKGTENVARELIKKGACIDVEVDGDSIEELLEEKMANLLHECSDYNRQDKDTIENKLFHLLYFENDNSGKFMELWKQAESNNNVVNADAHLGNYTFLQYCADHGYDHLVKFLLAKGASPNRTSPTYLIPPLVLAGHHGYYKVIQVFKDMAMGKEKININFYARDQIKKENVLHKIIKGESKSAINVESRHYDKCLNILLDNNPKYLPFVLPAINSRDQLGNTPIHIAAQLGKDDVVRKLLQCEANIGIKNNRMETPIPYISPEVMEEFLDDCLIDFGLMTDETFKLTFKYSFLGPPLMSKRNDTNAATTEDENNDDALEFKPTILDESVENIEEEDILQDLPEAEPLWYLALSKAHRHLLAHPVITSFLNLKWRRIRSYFYINLMIFFLYLICLTSYLLVWSEFNSNEALVSGLRYATLVFTVLIIIRESFQAIISARMYFCNLENVMEVIMLGISLYLVAGNGSVMTKNTRNLSAAAILFCWFEMFLMAGRHPKLSNYIKMFKMVSLKFLVVLLWYGTFGILSFGLAFYFILKREDTGESEEENAYFKTPPNSILKTAVMSLTGELEFEGIQFGDNYPGFGIMVYLSFIFFIMLVLMNLLNGLAITDISLIQKEAEILSYVSRVETIAFIESMIFGDPFSFLTNWPPFAWARRLPACDCFNIYRFMPIRQLLIKCMGDTLLFSERLIHKKAVFYPNKSRKEQSDLPEPDGLIESKKEPLTLDEEVIEAAKALLKKRNESTEINSLTSRLKQIEKSVLLLNKQQNLLLEKILEKN